MTNGTTPRLLELVYDALLKVFWRKRALKAFLRRHRVSEGFLSSWDLSSEGESKREFLDRLFPELERSTRGGQAVNQIARSLAEMATFPDLESWEDSDVKIRAAGEAVREIKAYLTGKDEERREQADREESQRRMRERQEALRRSQADLDKLTQRLTELHERIGTQQAGYDFQDWFYDLMDYCEIRNRRPYVHDGRQIDGSITIGDTSYLVELKFTSDQADATDIDTFHKKVTTKAENTMGVFMSISGFSSVAVREASGPKTPLLLFDHAHIFAVLGGSITFRAMVERVRRHASQTGESYLPIGRFGGA